MLVSLTYTSRPARSINSTDVRAIVDSSRRYNTTHGITGLLCFERAYFLQRLEGGREAVNELYGRLQRDDRHGELLLLTYEEVVEPVFKDWSMAYIGTDAQTRQHIDAITNGASYRSLDMRQVDVLMRRLKLLLHPQVVVPPVRTE